MKQVADEIREGWASMEWIAIVQRIGRLYPCKPMVLVPCIAAHCDMGVFDAAQYGIDRLKEIGPEGKERVEGSYIPKAGNNFSRVSIQVVDAQLVSCAVLISFQNPWIDLTYL